MKKLIIANWKNNPATLVKAKKLAQASDFKNVVVAPPGRYLKVVGRSLKRASLGAQNTGKAKYIILGHSDYRRRGDTDAIINKRVKRALKAGLKVILCVGESRPVRRKGIATAKKFVAIQLQKDLKGILDSRFQILDSIIIAYEPVWAISTSKGGKPDTPESASEMIRFIRRTLNSKFKIQNSKLLYGGSVNPRNAKSFLSQPEIDGALVGAASLNPKSFKAIINIR